MSATRLCKSLIYFCLFKETVAVLYGYTYYETPCIIGAPVSVVSSLRSLAFGSSQVQLQGTAHSLTSCQLIRERMKPVREKVCL